MFIQGSVEQKVTKTTKFLRKNPTSWFSLFPPVSPIRVIRVICGSKISRLLHADKAPNKIGFLWLNIELRGCRVTAWATM